MGQIAATAATLERKRALFPSLQRQHEAAAKEHEEILHLKKVKEDMISIKSKNVVCMFFFKKSNISSR
jgi:hypothetical protein